MHWCSTITNVQTSKPKDGNTRNLNFFLKDILGTYQLCVKAAYSFKENATPSHPN